MANILVLGAGVMGSAITVPLTDAGHVVRLVGTHLDVELIASIRQARFHPRLRSHLPESVAPYTNDQLGEAMRGADLVFLGVNSEGLDWAAERLRATLPPKVPVILLIPGVLERRPDVLRDAHLLQHVPGRAAIGRVLYDEG